jgi:hypothetical protein
MGWQCAHRRLCTAPPFVCLRLVRSGKSTILKQMQILSGTGFNAREIQTFREIIHANILDAIQVRIDDGGGCDWPACIGARLCLLLPDCAERPP